MSLLLTAGLAVLFTELGHLTGLSSEEAAFLQLGQADLSLEGLLLAGIVIGALGVLDDVTMARRRPSSRSATRTRRSASASSSDARWTSAATT